MVQAALSVEAGQGRAGEQGRDDVKTHLARSGSYCQSKLQSVESDDDGRLSLSIYHGGTAFYTSYGPRNRHEVPS